MSNYECQISNKLPNGQCLIGKEKYPIYERVFNFSVKTAHFLENLSNSYILVEYKKQLIRSSGSIGANLEEADGALTKRDFINKLGIARREANESKYWLRLIEKINVRVNSKEMAENRDLIQEATEIVLILSAIITNTQRNSIPASH